MSDFRFRALISVVFQPLCPACSLFLFRRINDDDDDENCWFVSNTTRWPDKCTPQGGPKFNDTMAERLSIDVESLITVAVAIFVRFLVREKPHLEI